MPNSHWLKAIVMLKVFLYLMYEVSFHIKLIKEIQLPTMEAQLHIYQLIVLIASFARFVSILQHFSCISLCMTS